MPRAYSDLIRSQGHYKTRYSSQIREILKCAKSLRLLVGAWGFELQASCAQGSCKKSILLVRLALFYVMVHGFGPNLAVLGPKLDPSFLCN